LGVDKWITQKDPLSKLPQGIKVSGDTIIISLKRHVKNPLFRFTLELFSIIPEKCIDKISNKITCEQPPASGYYTLTSSGTTRLEFNKREGLSKHNNNAPKEIYFDYKKVDSSNIAELNLENNEAIYGIDFFLISGGLDRLLNDFHFQVSNLPTSLFLSFFINPNIKPFNNKDCRLAFANQLRKTFRDIYSDALDFSGSIFTKIVPGYTDDLNSQLDPNIKDYFKDQNYQLHFSSTKQGSMGVLEKVIERTCKDIGIECVKSPSKINRMELESMFSNNETPFYIYGSGFWALDPVGDIQMFFTPKLHPAMKYVLEDDAVINKVNMIDNLSDSELSSSLKSFNQYVFEQGTMNTLLHARKVYISKTKDTIRQLPQAIASPYPWQIFNNLD